MTHAPVLGIDLGGTHIQAGLIAADGLLLARRGVRTEAREGAEHVIENIVRTAHEMCDDAGISASELSAAGVAAAGAIDMPNGVILVAPNLKWHDVPLRDLLSARLGCPVVLENDVNGAVWGEYCRGAARDRRGDALGVWVGTGVGGGLVINGALHHGDLHTAGEIGHTVADPRGLPGRCLLEELCSRTGMRQLVLDEIDDHPECPLYELRDGDPMAIGTAELHAAYRANDPLVLKVVHRAAELLGIAIANQVTMLAVDTVIVGGGVTETFGAAWLERIQHAFTATVFPAAHAESCVIRATELAADAGLIGAALCAQRAGR